MKRLLAALITVVLAFAVGSPASAQTATPSPMTCGYYENSSSFIQFVGTWSDSSTAGYSGGTAKITQTASAYASFVVDGPSFMLIVYMDNSNSDNITICVDGNCANYAGTAAGATFQQRIAVNNLGYGTHTVTVMKQNTFASRFVYFDALMVLCHPAYTPAFPTQLPYLTQAPYLTQIPPLTEIPQFTQIVPYTQIPPLTQIPLPETWTPFPTPEPQFTQIPPLTQYPLPETWTPFPTPEPYPTQIPYPTPLDTWTPQALAMVVITIDGSFFALDWNGLLTIFPTLITQIPATSTPTETLTPSITPTPSVTPTTTPPGYVQYDLPGADGTPAATGVLYIEATAGDLANTVLLFLIALVGLVGFTYRLWQGRKVPIE